ncbi:class II aldolase/adducin family protein [Parapusillimonas granuli]|uniref:Class II aldolase/adducin family protein n=1 Tax=Parapusillimonas granuli TaxID=380911 RepID=A0A853FZ74_9BURK|nr:class II aldolase/adducin family protein [Parapusillimonas granuli]MBB5214291.1 ribulose-5-phosphate 4-epimerase/fuculose-1-phosphate aldolase [Parapusillimonas granuli]NYT51395.1 class II aldolase/adducin family protein [Parapusillimonas granuli]
MPKKNWSDDERKVREDLAAAYRLVALLGFEDSIWTHISARVPGHHDQFLLNPHGVLFRDVTASSLVKIGVDGEIIEDTPHNVNAAGFTIHSAIHGAREDAGCVVHLHTVAGVAVSSLACGLVPANQWSYQFYDRVAYHDFEGIALNLTERERLVKDLGPTHRTLILRNHGMLTLGRDVAEAFILMRNLECACQAQIAFQATGMPISEVPADVCEHTARQYEVSVEKHRRDPENSSLTLEWNALVRRLSPPDATSHRD